MKVYIIDWYYTDEVDPLAPAPPDYDPEEYEEEQIEKMQQDWNDGHKRLVIWGFGRDRENNVIRLRITDFAHFYHIAVPNDFKDFQINTLKDSIHRRLPMSIRSSLTSVTKLKARSLYGFSGDDYFNFLTLSFRNTFAHRKSSYMFNYKVKIGSIPERQYRVYESKIDPIMRLIHVQNLNSVGWVDFDLSKCLLSKSKGVTTYEVSYKNLKRYECSDIPKISYAAFDIEADSSHGDFPIGKKDYIKLARDLISHVQNNGTPSRLQLKSWLKLAFQPHYYNPNILAFKEEQIASIDTDMIPVASSEILDIFRQSQSQIHNTEGVKGDTLSPCQIYNTEGVKGDTLSPCQQHIYRVLTEYFLMDDVSDTDYSRMASTLYSELQRMVRTNNPSYLNQPLELVESLLGLFFEEGYTNPDINRVFTVNGETPSGEILEALANQAYHIAVEASTVYRQVYGDKILLKNTQAHRRREIRDKLEQRDHNDSAQKKYQDFDPKDPLEIYISQLRDIFNKHLPPVVGDPVIQIGTTIKKYGESDCYLKHIITLKNCEPIVNSELIADEHKDVQLAKYDIIQALEISNDEWNNGDYETLNARALEVRHSRQRETDQARIVVESYDTEAEVLLAWTRLIQREDPDIITGYNIYGYDFIFMYERACELGIASSFVKLARIAGTGGIKEHQIASAAMGDKKQYYLDMPGRVLIDMQDVARAQLRLDSYKLDNVCRVVLNKSKNDLPPDQIFIRQKGTDYDRYIIAKYCLIDCVLCNRLMDKLEIILNQIGLAQVCSVPLSYIFLRGQGIRILSLTARQCRDQKLLIPSLDKDTDETSYEGAIVLDPDVGIYTKPVSVADFNSLYPSCMISENLSHDSFVSSIDLKLGEQAEDYRDKILDSANKYERMLLAGKFPGWSYVDIIYDTYIYVDPPAGGRKRKKIKTKNGQRLCRFAQPPDGAKSTLPNILIYVLKKRKEMKKTRDTHPKGSFEWNVYEGLQLAYKVVANSMYGQLGSKTGPIRFKDIACCVTATGRALIHHTQDFILKNYPDSEIVYGDSVPADTPILIEDSDGHWSLREIADLFPVEEGVGNSNPNPTMKEYYTPDSKTPWGAELKVWSDSGWSHIKRVMRHQLAPEKDLYRIINTSGVVEVTSDHSLLTAEGLRIKPNRLEIGQQLLTGDPWPLLTDYLAVYNQTGVTETIKAQELAIEIRSEAHYVNGILAISSSVPGEILTATRNIALAFLKRIFKDIKYLEAKRYLKLCFNSKKVAQSFNLLFRKLRFQTEISAINRYNSTATILTTGWVITAIPSISSPSQTSASLTRGVVTDIIKLDKTRYPVSKYVYDLETVNGHFQAGIGDTVVHNTDSVFGLWPTVDRFGKQLTGQDAINKSIELCTEAAEAISNGLKKPHNLEFEKTIYPFALATRKKYHGHYYTEYGSSNYSVKSMGIVLKRRDNAPIVKHVYSRMLNTLMSFASIEDAKRTLKEDIGKIIRGEFPDHYFILSKTLKGYYKEPDKIAHNVLAQRIGRRDPGNKPQSNDRIAYIHIINPDGVLQGDKIETPEFIRENKLKIDYNHYVMNAIFNPVVQILDLIMKDAKKYYTQMVNDFRIEASNQIRLNESSDIALRTLLRRHNLTREQVAEKLGLDPYEYIKLHKIRSIHNPCWTEIVNAFNSLTE